MGSFTKRDLNKPQATSGGNYFDQPGNYECLIVGWKKIETKQKENALVVDLKILNVNPHYATGSIRNWYLGENNMMFEPKAKNMLVAASGLSPGLDADKIEGEDWFAVLEASVHPPFQFLNKKINVAASYEWLSDGKKKLKKNPGLENDADFIKEYQFLKVEMHAHDETRARTLELLKKAK